MLRWAGAALAVVLLAAWGRVYFEARSEFEKGAELQKQGKLVEAVRHYQWSLRWYSPGASTPGRAADRLLAMADAAAAKGDLEGELRALRALRGGILATRSTYSPFGDRLPPLNARLAKRIAAQQMALGQPTIRGRSLSQLEAGHLALLSLDHSPALGWTLLVLFGFFGWVGGAFGLIFRGLDREVRLQPGFKKWAALVAVSFALWLLGLWKA